MDTNTTIDGAKAVIVLDGKLTVQTVLDLKAAVDSLPESISDVDLDIASLGYVSSAGLRAFVATDKLMVHRGGALRLLYPCDDVARVLEMTGISEAIEVVEA